jgi:hypothetical protein
MFKFGLEDSARIGKFYIVNSEKIPQYFGVFSVYHGASVGSSSPKALLEFISHELLKNSLISQLINK